MQQNIYIRCFKTSYRNIIIDMYVFNLIAPYRSDHSRLPHPLSEHLVPQEPRREQSRAERASGHSEVPISPG